MSRIFCIESIPSSQQTQYTSMFGACTRGGIKFSIASVLCTHNSYPYGYLPTHCTKLIATSVFSSLQRFIYTHLMDALPEEAPTALGEPYSRFCSDVLRACSVVPSIINDSLRQQIQTLLKNFEIRTIHKVSLRVNSRVSDHA